MFVGVSILTKPIPNGLKQTFPRLLFVNSETPSILERTPVNGEGNITLSSVSV